MAKAKAKPIIRRWTAEDIPDIVACHRAAYPEYDGDSSHYDERIYSMQFQAFPEGQALIEIDEKVVAYATALIVQLDDDKHLYTYEELTGDGTFTSHNPAGDTLYGADIAVHPDYRGLGLSKLLYEERRSLLKRYNLRRMVAYGRLPGYAEYAGQITAEEYVNMVSVGELDDPALNAHLRAGYQVKRVLLDILQDDPSLNYCTYLEMPNPYFDAERRHIAAAPIRRPVRKIRVCAAQYRMSPIESWAQFETSVTHFVTTADAYHSHFLLFPELFTAQLLSILPPAETLREGFQQLAALEDDYVELMRQLAYSHKLYICGGTHPVMRNGELYNRAHLFTPAGNVHTQDKLHVPQIQREEWGIRPGKKVFVFDTPLARVAMQIGYDIEYPEVSRLLALAGVELILVPFNTEEQRAYQRVRFTAQARAVENSLYVALAGNVGDVPFWSPLLTYSQSAILTPSDFAFPTNATATEATADAETFIIADLDLTSLVQHRELGKTRPLQDRRLDLYDLRAKGSMLQVIRTE
jgi:predicted amidohydrolase/GNAT superfamily N-acetyltransferase